MSMTKGTPLSSQIIWLEERVKELETICVEQKNELISIKRGQYFKENKKLQERVEELKDQVQYKQNTIDALTAMCNNQAMILRRMAPDRFPDTYFIHSGVGNKDQNGMPEKLLVCPAYGVDFSYVYERTEKTTGPKW